MAAERKTPPSSRARGEKSVKIDHDKLRNESFTCTATSGDESQTEMPSIAERLAYLRPSRELLEYYRRKIAEYDSEHDVLISKLDDYKQTCEDQHRVHFELRQREQEVTELHKAISELQLYLFEEREHVLRLYAENDRIKLEQLEDKMKIQQLLQLSGLNERELVYFVKEPPGKVIIEQLVPPASAKSTTTHSHGSTTAGNFKRTEGGHSEMSLNGHVDKNHAYVEKGIKSDRGTSDRPVPHRGVVSVVEFECVRRENENLKSQLEALQKQIEERDRLAKERIDALVEEARLRVTEFEQENERNDRKTESLMAKTKKTQELLYDATRDFLELRLETRRHERAWMTEKDSLLHEIERLKDELRAFESGVGKPVTRLNVGVAASTSHGASSATMAELSRSVVERLSTRHADELRNLEAQLEQQTRLAELYREQVVELEEELARLREEGDVTKELFRDRTEKVTDRLRTVQERYAQLERRRNLENEGFKNDIRTLRSRLKALEKQLYKVTIELGSQLDGGNEQLVAELTGTAMSKRADAGGQSEQMDLAMLGHIQKTAKRSKKIADQLRNVKTYIYNLENDLRHL